MSRIGKQAVLIPEGARVRVFGARRELNRGNWRHAWRLGFVKTGVGLYSRLETVFVRGPKGELSFTLPPFLEVDFLGNTLSLKPKRPLKFKVQKEVYGLCRTALSNMVKGVTEGFQKRLRLTGVGYRAVVEDGCLVLNVGYSQVVKVVIPEYISLQCETPTSLVISGIEKYQVGNFASKIRLIRPPEPYKGKGISYEDELIRRKPGKTGK